MTTTLNAAPSETTTVDCQPAAGSTRMAPGPLKLCPGCPWRRRNHGKPTPGGFYRKDNLRRLWNQIRKGQGIQSCHLTDPGHPDHVAAGAAPTAQPRECAGSIALVHRETRKIQDCLDQGMTEDSAPPALPAGEPPRADQARPGLLGLPAHHADQHPAGEDPIPEIEPGLVNDEELVARLPEH